MNRNLNTIRSNWDWWLIATILALMVLGIINLYSAAYNPERTFLFDINTLYGKQIMWIGIGIFMGVVISLIDSEFIRKLTPAAFIVVTLLLIIVLFSRPINGARSWLGFGSFGVQPSEFAKVTTGLMLAYLIGQGRIKMIAKKTVYQVLLLVFVTMILILAQNDTGTFLVFTAFFFVMYREGITFDPIILYFLNNLLGLRYKSTWVGVHFIPVLFGVVFFSIITLYFAESKHSFAFLPALDVPGWAVLTSVVTVLGIVVALIINQFASLRAKRKMLSIILISYIGSILLIGAVSFTYLKVLQFHQKVRIDLWLGKLEDKDGEDYNRNRALAAVGSGGFAGNGYHQAVLASPQSNHVPESETDFIFCVYAEEWGFIGSLIMVALFTFLLVRLVILAERQRSRFARVYAYSVAMIIFYHFAINIGMNVGLLPVIGIPLPFFSYGGSSMMAFSVMFFILLKLDSQRKDVLAT
jgi:rod shape determining protein RodA